jgi:hypothetical protein
MAAEPKPKAAAKKKRRRAAREEFVDCVVEIEGWDWGACKRPAKGDAALK